MSLVEVDLSQRVSPSGAGNIVVPLSAERFILPREARDEFPLAKDAGKVPSLNGSYQQVREIYTKISDSSTKLERSKQKVSLRER